MLYELPRCASGKEPTCQRRRPKRCMFSPWVRFPWKRARQPTPVFLPGESHGQRSLVGYSPWGHRVGHDWSDWAHTHRVVQYILRAYFIPNSLYLLIPWPNVAPPPFLLPTGNSWFVFYACESASFVIFSSLLYFFNSRPPWTAAYQVPLSMGFSRQEYWSGLPCPSPGDLPDPGIEPRSPALRADTLPSEPPGSKYTYRSTMWTPW